MSEALDQLVSQVRQSVPQPNKIAHLHVHENPGVVTFRWETREFLVRKSMQVLEMKGKNLFITGSSILMESALKAANKNEQVIEAASSMLRQAEDMINGDKVQVGLDIVSSVKGTLQKLQKTAAR